MTLSRCVSDVTRRDDGGEKNECCDTEMKAQSRIEPRLEEEMKEEKVEERKGEEARLLK